MDTNQFMEDNEEDYQFVRESLEDMMQDKYDYEPEIKFNKYQPVLYEVVKDPQQLQEKESLIQAHDRFIEKSESILKLHH